MIASHKSVALASSSSTCSAAFAALPFQRRRSSTVAAAAGSFSQPSAHSPSLFRLQGQVARRQQQRQQQKSKTALHAAASAYVLPVELGKQISSTEVPAFIPRDDMIDQLYRWSRIEAGEGGMQNFGMPMNVEPVYQDGILWGFKVGIFKEGTKLTDLAVLFDNQIVVKHEWVGRGEDGMPMLEGRTENVKGKNIEIW